MLIHNVFFWMNPDLDDDACAAFEHGLRTLCQDTPAKGGYFGKPAATPDREVIESSYGYGLVLIFEDMAAHDTYQDCDVHQQFIADHHDKWTKIGVYDIETE